MNKTKAILTQRGCPQNIISKMGFLNAEACQALHAALGGIIETFDKSAVESMRSDYLQVVRDFDEAYIDSTLPGFMVSYFRFYFCTFAAQEFINLQQEQYAFEFLQEAIMVDPINRKISIDQLNSYLPTKELKYFGVLPASILWCAMAFRLADSQLDLGVFVKQISNFSDFLIRQGAADNRIFESAVTLLERQIYWCAKNDYGQFEKLKCIWDDISQKLNLSISRRKSIEAQLCLINYDQEKIQEFTRSYESSFEANDKIIFYSRLIQFDAKLVDTYFDAICSAVAEVVRELQYQYLAQDNLQSRIAESLKPLTFVLMKNGQIKRLILLLQNLYLGSSYRNVIENAVCLFLAREDSVWISGEGTSVSWPTNNPIGRIVDISNRLLGEENYGGAPGYQPENPKRINPAFFAEYQQELESIFDLENARDLILGRQTVPLLYLPAIPIPIQALLSKKLSITPPLSVSLLKPLEDRPIKKVLIWDSGSFTMDKEREYLVRIFEQARFEVNVISGKMATGNAFLAEYHKKDYDLIWVISHGNFNDLSPYESGIQTGGGDDLKIREILEQSAYSDSRRRLLVLNLCEGMKFKWSNGISRFGIGPTMVSDKQAVISHLWPVDNLYASMAGVVLAHELVQCNNYLEAYSNSISSLSRGREKLYEFLNIFPNKFLRDRLDNSSLDVSNIYYWGSLAFYE